MRGALHVCPLSRVPAVLAETRAEWVVSLMALAHRLPDLGTIAPHRRLHLAVSDITQTTPDYVLASEDHVVRLLAFLDRWDRDTSLLIHCYAGVSRSTAAAFIAACFLDPDVPESAHADRLRARSPTATPNTHLVALADALLGREGRMSAAAHAIGRGADCFEGTPFTLDVPAKPPSGRRS